MSHAGSEVGQDTRSPKADATPSIARQYGVISLFVVPALAILIWIAADRPEPVRSSAMLLGPVFAVLALTILVWILMLIARHTAVVTRRAEIEFFRVFDPGLRPAAWVERPAQAFNNLMQAPTVFYVLCALMMQVDRVDSVQLAVAWVFAVSRYVHAIALVGWNDVKWRFATALLGFLALGILIVRFAIQSHPLWQPF